MIDTVWIWLVDQITGNDVFAGLVGLSLLASVMYALRSVPQKLWLLFELQATIELTIHNTDHQFHWISQWLARHPYAARTRRLQLTSSNGGSDIDEPVYPSDESEDRELQYRLIPGVGRHWFFHRGRLVVVTHEIQEEQSKGSFLRQSYKLRMLGRRQDLFRDLINEARSMQKNEATVSVSTWLGDYWHEAARRKPRHLASVILPAGQTDSLLRDAEAFFSSAQWYADRGIPWRRGYLFSGPPGTGKTSLVFALASHFKRPLYSLSLGGVWSDNGLNGAFARVPQNAVLLIEDIDAAKTAASRDGDGEKVEECTTLSGLLNAIDGVSSTEGRLLVMTTNHPDKLDAALVRAGRVDRHERIEPLGAAEAMRMFERFYPGADAGEFLSGVPFPIPAAELQERLIHRANGAADSG